MVIAGFWVLARAEGRPSPRMVRGLSTVKGWYSPAGTTMMSPGLAPSIAAWRSPEANISEAPADPARTETRMAMETRIDDTARAGADPIVLDQAIGSVPGSVSKVAHACEDHGHAVFVCSFYHLSIP